MSENPENDAWQKAVEHIEKTTKKSVYSIKKIDINIDDKSLGLPIYSGKKLTPLSVGDMSFIDASTAKKLKQATLKIEKTLDLHGFYEDDAFAAVNDFVISCYNKKMRSICIITGKGKILKDKLPQWLNLSLRPLILAFSYMPDKFGGTGAYNILLKRH